MSAISIYNDNVGLTHEAAVQAVYDAGIAAGGVAPVVSIQEYPDLSAQLVAANAEIANLQAQLEAVSAAAHAAASSTTTVDSTATA